MTMDMEQRTDPTTWHLRFMRLAIEAASWSKDPQKKVGAVIVNNDRRLVAMGYNGFPIGTPDLRQDLLNEDFKRDHMVHAELNAILNAVGPLGNGSTMYSTRHPCHECAKAIVQSGVRGLVTAVPDYEHPTWGKSYRVASEVLRSARVPVSCLPTLGYNGAHPVLS